MAKAGDDFDLIRRFPPKARKHTTAGLDSSQKISSAIKAVSLTHSTAR